MVDDRAQRLLEHQAIPKAQKASAPLGKAPDPVESRVLDRQAESRAHDRAQRRREAPFRADIIRRHQHVEWPLDARSLERADLDPGDVRQPLPPPLPVLDVYREAANNALTATVSGTLGAIEVDSTLVIARGLASARERAAAQAMTGPAWTLDIVAARIDEAFRVLLRMPETARPRGFGSAMPRPMAEMADLVARAENGSLSRIRSRLNRRFGIATQVEQRRMGEALCWPVEYLAALPDHEVALFVNLGGMSKAMGVKTVAMCRELGIWSATYYAKRRSGLDVIVRGLQRSGKAPT